MAHWIICCDPWLGLKTPAPALYPEWDGPFRHYPGRLSASQKRDIALALAENATPPEVWLLASSAQTPAEIDEADMQIQACLAELSIAVPALRLVWRVPQGTELLDRGWKPQAGIAVDLILDGNDGPQAAERARAFLLPLALRFLLERERLLAADGRVGIGGLELKTQSASLDRVIAAIQTRLLDAAKHARYQLDNLDLRPSGQRFFDVGFSLCPETLQSEPVPVCGFGHWYRRQRDERNAADWIIGQTDGVLRRWQMFEQRVEQWRKDTLQRLTKQCPDRNEPKKTPAQLRQQFLQEIDLLAGPANPAQVSQALAEHAAKLRDSHIHGLIQAIRRRPQRRVFLGHAGLLLVLTLGYCSLGARWSQAFPSLWQALPVAALIISLLLVLAVVRFQTLRTLKHTRIALEGLELQALKAGDALKEAVHQAIKRIFLHRNLGLVEAELQARQTEREQWQYHLARMRKLFDALGTGRRWYDYAQQDQGSLFDPAQPDVLNPAYHWKGDGNPLLKLGRDLRHAPVDGRFGGVDEIIVRGAGQ